MSLKTLESNSSYSEETFKRLELNSAKIRGTEFSDCKFSRCEFSETLFNACRFIDCVFEDCTMKLANLDGSSFARVKFRKSSLYGVNWTEANWADWSAKLSSLSFDDCDLSYALFFGLELKKLQMKNCIAREANFSEAILSEADFEGTDFSGAVFHKTDLTKANFVGAKNYGLKLSDNKTKGAKFSLPEASRLLFYMDILMIDPETKGAMDEENL
jgi:fluoroquinolone resistance protein